MKKSALSLIIAASLSAGTVMAAEPFKDRGIDYAATVQPDTSAQREAVMAHSNSFNDRGIDYVEAAPGGSDSPRTAVSIAVRGFNDRSHIAFTTEGQSVSAEDEVQLGYSR